MQAAFDKATESAAMAGQLEVAKNKIEDLIKELVRDRIFENDHSDSV